MLDGVSVGIDHLNQAVVAQPFHVTHLIAFRKRSMGGHDKTTTLAQLVDHVLFHADVLHEEEVGPIHLFGTNADLVCLADETVTMFVGRDIVFSFSTVFVDTHVIGDAVMVVAQDLIDTVDGGLFALPPVGQAEILARMAVEMVLFPLAGVHVLIRVVEVFTFKRTRFLETIGGHGEIDEEDEQQKCYAETSHDPAEIEPKAFMWVVFAHG